MTETIRRINGIAEKSMSGLPLTRADAGFVIGLSGEYLAGLIAAVFKVRKKYKGMTVGVQILTNARSGNCTQNCAYCAQSAESGAGIDKYRMTAYEKLSVNAKIAGEKRLARHCVGFSGLRFTDSEIEEFAAFVKSLKSESGLPVCCSIGFLTEAQARLLKASGVDRINHNLNTSRRFYPSICTTHTYDERFANILMLQKLGFEICCGGIIGMGETMDDVIDLMFDLREVNPQAVPVNFLIPLEGTPFFGADVSHLTPEYCLRALCLARLMIPQADIRCAAGREIYLKGREKEMFHVVDSIFAAGYLTAAGQSIDGTIEMVKQAGFEYVIE
ncbi:MAG: biotin synthase BioB [Acidobacteriota bacterium]|nr:biotin synthase BioB [Acidobacteriota bacterium]